jgi:NAD(P)H-dependent flavin oxidoreductase YrpB (nitropropane dioxygenase family)
LRSNDKLTRSQMLMAANSPILIKRAMVEGHPAEGVLPSGQVAGLIYDLPTCAELVERIVAEASGRLAALSSGAGAGSGRRDASHAGTDTRAAAGATKGKIHG